MLIDIFILLYSYINILIYLYLKIFHLTFTFNKKVGVHQIQKKQMKSEQGKNLEGLQRRSLQSRLEETNL